MFFTWLDDTKLIFLPFQKNVCKAKQKLEKLRCQFNWDQQALEAWLEACAQKDEDSMIILKYAKQDASKIRELSLNIEKLTDELIQRRRILDNELTDTITAQIELDKTAEDFRRAHVERVELLCQWENTIEQMRKRDQQIDECSQLLTEVKQEIREKEALIKERNELLQTVMLKNKQSKRNITYLDRNADKLREECIQQESKFSVLQSELESLKKLLGRTTTDLEIKKAQLESMGNEILEKHKKLKEAKETNEALTQKLKTFNESLMESSLLVKEKTEKMERTIKEMERTVKNLENQLICLKGIQAKRTEELQNQMFKEENIRALLNIRKTSVQSLNCRISKVDRKAEKQIQVVYNQDFRIQYLERKITRMEKEHDTEKQTIEAKTEELTKILQEKKATCSFLSTQLKRLQDEVRYLKIKLDKTVSECADLDAKIPRMNIVIDVSTKEVKTRKIKKQEALAEVNVMKLHIKRLRDLLYSKTDITISLEKRKLLLQNAMRERQDDIKVHREMLQNQYRLIDQERQAISMEVNEKLAKIEKLKKRYEVITLAITPPEGEQESTQAYYIIKAAQEKEELVREGNELDTKIRKAEKEVEALENTLDLLNRHNSTYRKSVNKVTDSGMGEDYEEKLKLEDKNQILEGKYLDKAKQKEQLQEEIQSMNNMLENLKITEASLNTDKLEIESQIKSLNKEVEYQKEKLDRAKKQCLKLHKEINSSRQSEGEIPEEQDIMLRELRDFSKSLNKMIVEAMVDQPNLALILEVFYNQAQIPLPSFTPISGSAPGSRQSSRLSTARGSGSSTR
ncbi:coiled-coil domain-containing protein 39-like isoform X1 [Erpetoichthys calabaricus]|uniref:coiled-coil domain-containing protein 39-like isoform X1 n=1 Tax=Erpetoichthys calabaricus TaxID=27687 RepID=UPI002234A42C|nr:coiled-coil domain-containing protein 39-like isoform X1 [Erpetoichthys calabaricus]